MTANRTWPTTAGDKVEVYETPTGYRWRVRAGNGEIVGSGEEHPDIRDAEAAALRHHPRVEPWDAVRDAQLRGEQP